MNRRTLLTRLVAGTGLIIAGVAGVPALILSLSPTLRRRGATWRAVGNLNEFNVGEVRRATVEVPRIDWVESLAEKAVYVWRPAPDQVVVFSRNCTDLSCPVKWDAGSERFFCPCHGGIFTKEGEVVAGPPRRPLWRYATRIQNGLVEIDLDSLPPMT